MSDDVEPFGAELLRIEVRYRGNAIVPDGEFDMTGVERFVACVVDTLETRPEFHSRRRPRSHVHRLVSVTAWLRGRAINRSANVRTISRSSSLLSSPSRCLRSHSSASMLLWTATASSSSDRLSQDF